jgi:hypothetical protein
LSLEMCYPYELRATSEGKDVRLLFGERPQACPKSLLQSRPIV